MSPQTNGEGVGLKHGHKGHGSSWREASSTYHKKMPTSSLSNGSCDPFLLHMAGATALTGFDVMLFRFVPHAFSHLPTQPPVFLQFLSTISWLQAQRQQDLQMCFCRRLAWVRNCCKAECSGSLFQKTCRYSANVSPEELDVLT